MKKAILIICLLSIISLFSFADSVFSIDLLTDISMGIGAAGLFTISQIIEPHIGLQQPQDEINPIDHSLMYDFNKSLDDLGTYSAYAALMIPAISVLYEIDFPDRFLTYGIMYIEAFLLTYGSKDLLKALISRHRPYTYLESIPEGEDKEYYNSFPSGHTSFAFLGATFLSFTFNKEYPQSNWRLPVTICSYSLAGTIAISRIFSGSHFISDVVTGAAIGTLWGWLVPQLHYRGKNENLAINLLIQPAGIEFSIKM